jgi:CDP-glycerol glycerophosphotransferase
MIRKNSAKISLFHNFSKEKEKKCHFKMVLPISFYLCIDSFTKSKCNNVDSKTFLKLARNSKLYKKCMKPFMCLFRFLPLSGRKIIVNNYNGKGYGDNAKYIVDEIRRQQLTYDLVWIVEDGSNIELPAGIRKVRMWSLRCIYELSTAKVIISNVKNYLPFLKRSSQYYIQTWHGPVPFKYIEQDAVDLLSPRYIKESQQNSSITDVMISCNAISTRLFRNSFWYDGEVYECGAPRSDIFFSGQSVKDQLKKQMGVAEGQRIVLYCPTFRDNGSINAYDIDTHQILNTLQKTTGQSWVMMIRMHPNDSKGIARFTFDQSVMNMTNYPDMQELIFVADMQISDYSSTIAEFIIMQKPVFIYASDLEEYSQSCRGLSPAYYELPIHINRTNDELIQSIEQYDEAQYRQALVPYLQHYNSFDDGHASERVVERIKCVIDGTFRKPDRAVGQNHKN